MNSEHPKAWRLPSAQHTHITPHYPKLNQLSNDTIYHQIDTVCCIDTLLIHATSGATPGKGGGKGREEAVFLFDTAAKSAPADTE